MTIGAPGRGQGTLLNEPEQAVSWTGCEVGLDKGRNQSDLLLRSLSASMESGVIHTILQGERVRLSQVQWRYS
jgi:hypothetical protein